MTVYVDSMKAPFGRYIMCHMWADTRDELFAMIDTIGVQRKWFQRPDGPDMPAGMKASWEHFDIAQSKRALAVAAGAVETDKYGPLEWQGWRDLQSPDIAVAIRALRKLLIIWECRQL